ncbi:hypothetical protein RIF29_42509 [Crotalaria pallida]|uniref:Magnesium transporter n=1 Tax=Crotalaria pallida TaxID=3830 RepID=A0AAN9HTP8_CROPI
MAHHHQQQQSSTAHAHACARRKGGGYGIGGGGVKAWMVVSERGESRLEEVGKHYIMRRTGLPARDLRALDPMMLSQPASILGRERAIVINLEHIKAIITATEVLIINSSNPLFLLFLNDLHSRILLPSHHHHNHQTQMSNDMDVEYRANTTTTTMEEEEEVEEGSSSSPLRRHSSNSGNNEDDFLLQDKSSIEIKLGSSTRSNSENNNNNVPETPPPPPKQLPFEFRALEACLESACRCLESETKTLEEEAYPALDELTDQISTLNLERVRQIKSRLVALSGRVHKVRDQIENLLDDDNDMAEMYLTQKRDARLLDHTSSKEGEFEDEEQRDESHSKRSFNSSEFKLDVEELEMLLEAYFAQINGILQKLSSLSEYVDDTEDYINIMLDDKQNQLLQGSVILNLLNMVLNAGIVVVGLFGMNIHIDLFDAQPRQFWATALGTLSGCILLFFISLFLGKKRYLLSSS